MKRIHIFKPGKHTSANGKTLEFTEQHLQDAVNAYDPALHEAPIVVGHPADNGPAFGWVGGLEYADAGLYAKPRQVEEQFSEQVQAGRYKKVSASFYTPDAPNNPAPGSYYLRHVGFLGAQPPSIKGLDPIQFSEAEEGVIEFNELANDAMTRTLKRLREWIIDKFSRDEADSVVPEYAIEDLEIAQQMERDAREREAEGDNAIPDFNEQDTPTEDNDMTLQQQLEAAQARIQELEGNTEQFSEREQALNQREREIAKTELKTRISAVADEGRVLPADVDALTEFAAHLDAQDDNAVAFAEGEQAQAPREFFLSWLAKQPKRVDYNEHSNEQDDPEKDAGPGDVANRIVAYRENQAAQGVTVTYDQALRDVKSNKDRAE